MLHKLAIATTCLGIAFCSALYAATGDALIERLNQPSSPVLDRANLLSSSKEERLNTILDKLHRDTGASLVVVTLPSMEGGQIDDFTNRLFEKWGVGDARENNGAMLLVAVKERKMRIEVGYGLEGAIPDGLAGEVRDKYVLAYFKKGNMESGVEAGSLKLAELIAKHYGATVDAKAKTPKRISIQRSDDFWSGLVIFAFIAIYIISLIVKSFNDDDWGGGSYGRRRRHSGSGWYIGGGRSSGGGFSGGGGFGGFGGGMSGGGGASGGW